MSKLFKVKDWISVESAAKHLAMIFGEEVSEADILRFALDGKLVLSVNFVNGGHARAGELIPIQDATYEEVVFPLSKEPIRLYGGPKIYTDGIESHILKLNKEIVSLRGIYNLPMIGGEKIEVEREYQQLTGGPEATNVPMDGAFVEAQNGILCQIQNDYDDNEYCKGSTASLERIKKHIRLNKFLKSDADNLIKQHNEDRIIFLKERKLKPITENYYAGGDLPEDTVLVVRTDALNDFVQSVNSDSKIDKTLETKERDSLLKLVIGMAIDGYGYDPKASRSTLPKELADCFTLLNIDLSDDTIRKYLKQATEQVLPAKSTKT